jgi:hypothetical protein
MSSPRTAKKTAKPARAAKPAKKPALKSVTAAAGATSEATAQATKLAAEIERAIIDGDLNRIAPEAMQDLMAALCKNYSAQVEAGNQILPLRGRTSVTSTDIMTTASGLLKAANLAVFELGMWQSWTGR